MSKTNLSSEKLNEEIKKPKTIATKLKKNKTPSRVKKNSKTNPKGLYLLGSKKKILKRIWSRTPQV